MKKKLTRTILIVSALAALILLAIIPNYSTNAANGNFWTETEDEITIDKTVHDFGTIKENGGNVSATFKITNNTKAPVLLAHVSASCGCTVPTWTKDPIEPGKTGEVTATFNPIGRPGPFEKTITIITNGNPVRITAKIKGTVE
jgi:hypothetical protein